MLSHSPPLKELLYPTPPPHMVLFDRSKNGRWQGLPQGKPLQAGIRYLQQKEIKQWHVDWMRGTRIHNNNRAYSRLHETGPSKRAALQGHLGSRSPQNTQQPHTHKGADARSIQPNITKKMSKGFTTAWLFLAGRSSGSFLQACSTLQGQLVAEEKAFFRHGGPKRCACPECPEWLSRHRCCI